MCSDYVHTVWEDLAVWNVDFISIFKNLSIKDLGILEKHLLRFLEYNVSVPSSLYAKYYFELRELAEKNSKTFPLTPLDKERAEQLEVIPYFPEEMYCHPQLTSPPKMSFFTSGTCACDR